MLSFSNRRQKKNTKSEPQADPECSVHHIPIPAANKVSLPRKKPLFCGPIGAIPVVTRPQGSRADFDKAGISSIFPC